MYDYCMTRGIITLITQKSHLPAAVWRGDLLACLDTDEGWSTPMPFSEFQAESGLPNAGQVWTDYVRAFS